MVDHHQLKQLVFIVIEFQITVKVCHRLKHDCLDGFTYCRDSENVTKGTKLIQILLILYVIKISKLHN